MINCNLIILKIIKTQTNIMKKYIYFNSHKNIYLNLKLLNFFLTLFTIQISLCTVIMNGF